MTQHRRMGGVRPELAEQWQKMTDDGLLFAKFQLEEIVEYANAINEMLASVEDIPDWMEAKIVQARTRLGSVKHTLEHFLR